MGTVPIPAWLPLAAAALLLGCSDPGPCTAN